MKVTDDRLMRYLDGELSTGEETAIRDHLAASPADTDRLHTMQAERDAVSAAMRNLAPGSHDLPDTRRALARLQQTQSPPKETFVMTVLKNKQTRQLAAGVAALVVLIGLFTLAPVRAFASDLLGMFRVERFVVVEVDEERLDAIFQLIDEDSFFGEMEMIEEPAEPVEAASVEEAAGLAGLTPRLPAELGAPTSIMVEFGSTMEYTPSVEDLRLIFTGLEMDPNILPDTIDGQTFTIQTFPGIGVAYEEDGVMLFQGLSPVMDAPEGVDAEALGSAMLQLMGMSAEEAARMSDSIDWTTTLVLPIPSSELDSFQEVEVDGVSGLAFTGQDWYDEEAQEWHSGGAGVMWQKDGRIYMLATENGNMVNVLGIASSLQ